jgi:hypothetical protein
VNLPDWRFMRRFYQQISNRKTDNGFSFHYYCGTAGTDGTDVIFTCPSLLACITGLGQMGQVGQIF